jgi:hypothetical protein
MQQRPEDYLISQDEYARIDHPVPYNFQIEANGKLLSYFGARHSSDPKDPMFDELERNFKDAKPDLVLIEGARNIAQATTLLKVQKVPLSRDEIIRKHGESIYAASLAISDSIEVESPEPDRAEEVATMEKRGFSREEIFSYYCGRVFAQYLRRQDKPILEEYMTPYLRSFQDDAGWKGFDFSLPALLKTCEKFSGHALDPDSLDISELTDPIKREGQPWGRLNEVAAASNRFRDEHIIGRIEQSLKGHSRIFIVFGSSHAVIQEPAIRKIMEHAGQD